MTEENHRINWDDMQVIDTAREYRRLLLKEMLHINNLKPKLKSSKKRSKLFSVLIGSRENKFIFFCLTLVRPCLLHF
jgi:hypothetical protein